MDTLLQQIYLKNSDLFVAFLGEDYERREWCGLEWRAIREFTKSRTDHSIMFMRFDDEYLSSALTINGYVDLGHHTPVQASHKIVVRVRLDDLLRRSQN